MSHNITPPESFTPPPRINTPPSPPQISLSESVRLQNLKAQIQTLKTEIALGKAELSGLVQSLRSSTQYLDRLKSLGLIDQHNALVPEHNMKVAQAKALAKSLQRKIDEHNRLVREYNRLIR